MFPSGLRKEAISWEILHFTQEKHWKIHTNFVILFLNDLNIEIFICWLFLKLETF